MTAKENFNPLFRVHRSMINRCHNPNVRCYKNYGGRGITVCERWRYSFVAFLEDMGERPPGGQIDRIDNNKGYSPENCRWLTNRANCRNKRTNLNVTAFGKTACITEWSEITGINWSTLLYRIKAGWNPEIAFTTKSRQAGSPVPKITIHARFDESNNAVLKGPTE